MTAASVVDLGVERLVRLEQRIGGAEGEGLRARWEFGRELLAARDGKGRLPNGYLTAVCAQVGASRSEVKYRVAFAERYPAEEQLATAVASYGSWTDLRERGLLLPPEVVVTDPATPLALPQGVYQTLVADPPWQYGNKATRGAAANHYDTLSIGQLTGDEPLPDGRNLAEEVAQRTAERAHLYLWATNGFLREAFDVLAAWGFTYKTCLTWVKPQLGLGNYFRSSTEHVLFGVRGGMRTLDSNQFNWFEARRGRHSAKPQHFYELAEKVSPGPYLELFARERRLGWDSWGLEA